jgi:hypothetical protein
MTGWDEPLRSRTRFFSLPSQIFFSYALARPLLFDLVLIDGDHELEAAAYDLACVARLIRPGGIVVLDNIDQPGPRFATTKFLADNPEWREIGTAVNASKLVGPLDEIDGSFPNTKFFILQAPREYVVSGTPYSFGSIHSPTGAASELTLHPASPARGKLHYTVFCRAFAPDRTPEELISRGSHILQTHAGEIRIPLSKTLQCTSVGEQVNYRTEIVLAFTGSGSRLQLAKPPVV